ncbi:MAG TPA: DUF4268 domain-containing protein [Polyangia bacterium]|nr:DUF4268 domain-containing protein [Polyangia bacterium]
MGFWRGCLRRLGGRTGRTRRLQAFGVSGVYAPTSDHRSRVELYIDVGVGERNKALFDRLRAEAGAIETAVGETLAWERLDGARACRVAAYRDVFITDDSEQLSGLRRWAIDFLPRFTQVFEERLAAAVREAG